MNRESIIKEIMTYPLSYALMFHFYEDGKWDENKLKVLEINDLNMYLRDMKTIEKNKLNERN